MSYRKALIIRAICSLSAYVGGYLGIIVGEQLKLSQWVYALAGGMFIYIALTNMVSHYRYSH